MQELLPSIRKAARLIRSGQLTPTTLVETCLSQIERLEPSLSAWVAVDHEEALEQATGAEKRLKAGDDPGPLLGIPIGVKDIIDVAGFPTLAGSPLRRETPDRFLAERDAPIVAALRQAGAVILGKTVTVEFACFDPSATCNPRDPALAHLFDNADSLGLDPPPTGESPAARLSPLAGDLQPEYTAGGSSSGSAAAVAAEMCMAALGTQTGGSLVRPASYCGVCAMKPTFARVDGRSIVPVTDCFDTAGPMARSVGDLAAVFRYLPWGKDFGPLINDTAAQTTEARCQSRSGESEGPSRRLDQRPPRIGLVRPFLTRADEATSCATFNAVTRLREKGATVEEVDFEPAVSFDQLLEIHTVVMAADAATFHKADYPRRRDAYGPMIASLLDMGLDLSAVEFSAALSDLRRARRSANDLLGDYDALLAPATDTTAPRSRETTGPKTFQAPWSCLGLPVVSLPCGLGGDGMPIAVQLVARYHDDVALLEIAAWCERTLGFFSEPRSSRVLG